MAEKWWWNVSHVSVVSDPTEIGIGDQLCLDCFEKEHPGMEELSPSEVFKGEFFSGCVDSRMVTSDGAVWCVSYDDYAEGFIVCENCNKVIHMDESDE